MELLQRCTDTGTGTLQKRDGITALVALTAIFNQNILWCHQYIGLFGKSFCSTNKCSFLVHSIPLCSCKKSEQNWCTFMGRMSRVNNSVAISFQNVVLVIFTSKMHNRPQNQRTIRPKQNLGEGSTLYDAWDRSRTQFVEFNSSWQFKNVFPSVVSHGLRKIERI